MVVFFDGICNLCQYSVRYLIQHDKNKTLKFASLQGKHAKKMIQLNGVNSLESMVFFDGKALYKKRAYVNFYGNTLVKLYQTQNTRL